MKNIKFGFNGQLKKTILIFILPTCLINCSSSEFQEDILDFKFRLLDENGRVSTEFREDENFVFSFLIINNSSEGVYFTKFLDMDDFFTVKKKDDNHETLVGKPYSSYLCEFIVQDFKISAKDTLKIEIQWQPAHPYRPDVPYYSSYFCEVIGDNEMLPTGNYYSDFTSDFEFFQGEEAHKISKRNFHIDFTVN